MLHVRLFVLLALGALSASAALAHGPARADTVLECLSIARLVDTRRAARRDECLPPATLARKLSLRHEEAPVDAVPYCRGRGVLVLWAGDRSWTVVARRPGGAACIVDAGLRRTAGL